jgi:hypothetical protein
MTFPTVRLEANLTAADTGTLLHLGDATRGLLGTGTLGGTDSGFTDLASYLRRVSTRRGSNRVEGPMIRYEAGTLQGTLRNEDRRFDPTNLFGPYVAAGETQLVPMRAVRLIADYSGTTYPIWRGFADSWLIDYQPPNYSECTLTCTDAFKVLANYIRAEQTAVGSGDDTGARVDRVLDSVDWAEADRLISTGDTALQATTLAGDALSELQAAVDSEMGELYVDESGRVVFRNRLALFTDTRSADTQAQFNDDGTDLPYANVVVEYDESQLINLARIGRTDGAPQERDDGESRTKYLTRSFERTDLLMTSDGAAADLASYIVRICKDPELRFAQIELRPLRDEALWPEVLGRQIGDRIAILRHPPGGGDPIERGCFIRGIDHDIDLGGRNWVTTWTLQSASGFEPPGDPYLVLGSGTSGLLGTNTLAP